MQWEYVIAVMWELAVLVPLPSIGTLLCLVNKTCKLKHNLKWKLPWPDQLNFQKPQTSKWPQDLGTAEALNETDIQSSVP